MVDPVQQSPLPTERQPPVDAANPPDPADAARDLLEVGEQSGTDNYDARVRAFAETLSQGDAAFQQEVIAEILRQDSNAFNSWMTPSRINAQVDAGHISQTDRSAMAEAIAGAYNNGDIPTQEVPGQNGGEGHAASALDTYLHNPGSTSLDGVDNQVEHARNMREFAEFFGGPHYSSEISEFRANYADHLIGEYALNGNVQDGMLRDNAATLAAIVLNGDPTRGDIAAGVLAGLDQGQLEAFMGRVARGGEFLTANPLEQIVPNSTVALRDDLEVSDVSLPDQFSSLLAQVSRIDSPEAAEAAAKLARLPAADGDAFDDGRSANAGDRIDAMGLMFSNHADSILQAYTEFDTTKIGSKDDADLKQYMQDASDLGALFNVVLFNDDQTYQGPARAGVLDYAAELKTLINTEEGNADAMGRLSMLMGAADDAITQGFNDLKAKEDAQAEMVSFIVDLAMAGIPVGDKAKTEVASLLGEVFSNSRVTEALEGVSGNLIDAATGRLTDEAKEALNGALGEDETELLDQQGASNALREALISGVENERDLAAIQNYAEDVSQGINIWRK